MADYQIICVTESIPPGHDGHIVEVGTSLGEKWSVQGARTAIDQGHTFHTVSRSTGKRAEVRKWNCRACGRSTLRSDPDAVADNNLDNLRPCN